MKFINSIQSEWMKTNRSAASWLCLIGGFFIPIIYLVGSIVNHTSINSNNIEINIWEKHFLQLWRNMVALLLPMGVILASSLITQLEYKNNTWKQLHSTPQSFTQIFFSKFLVIIFMTIKFFIFFNIGIIISGLLPCLLFDGHLPKHNIPFVFFVKENLKYFITCLPVIAMQYLISLNFKNFLVPIGVGLLGLIGSLIGLSWKYIFISPYSYSPLLISKTKLFYNVYSFAFIYFIVLMLISYYLYIAKKEKS